jgi:hypothetical protein
VTAPRVPDLLVERLAKGDLPADEAAGVRARLEAEGGLGRLEALREDDRAALDAHPPGPALAEIRRRAGLLGPASRTPAARRRRTLFVLAPALGTAALAALLVVRLPQGPGTGLPGAELEETTLKGLTPRLALYRQGAGGAPEPLGAGAAVRAGDTIQVAYVAAGRPFGAILSVDGSGTVTVHLPAASPLAAPLARGGETTLDHAYVLDTAPGFERFFLFTAAEPFPVAAVQEAVAGLAHDGRARDGRPTIPGGVEAAELLLVKAP